MNIKRFFGKNSREALSMVRKALGEDAVILSNRAMNGGNEIMAFKEEDMNNMIESQTDTHHSNGLDAPDNLSPKAQSSKFDSSEPTTLLSLLQNNRAQTPDSAVNKAAKIDMYDAVVKTASPQQTTAKVATTQTYSPQIKNSQQADTQMSEMLNEMRNMRSVIESQLTTLSWGNIQQRDPSKSKILSILLSAGFSASLARQLAEKNAR